MEREEVKRLLMTMQAIYPHYKIEDAQITLDAWETLLGDQNATMIFAALKHYARTNTSGYAPSAGQLIQTAYELMNTSSGVLNPSEAWCMVHKAICRGNYYAEEDFEKFPEEIKKAVGSHMQLKAWASDPKFNEGVASSNFRSAYETICERKKQDALMPPEVKVLIASIGDMKCLEG